MDPTKRRLLSDIEELQEATASGLTLREVWLAELRGEDLDVSDAEFATLLENNEP